MALFMKQNFNPPIFSRKWIAMKFRPNMLIYSRENIIAVLESGLLFREDSTEVEQEAPSAEVAWRWAGGVRGGWFTSGERTTAVLATALLIIMAPPRNVQRWTLARLALYALAPVAVRASHRARCRGALPALLQVMRNYMTLARRATACCREYAALHARLGSVASAIESTHTMLCRQQSEMLLLMSRATSALLGNVPWLRGDVVYDCDTENLTKIHHAFLVVQSTLLKNIAMAHFVPTAHALKFYKNHNERIYWIHNVLIVHLIQEFKDNYEALERMYRLLKNYGTKDGDSALKKPGFAINEAWLYSEVHTGVARSCLELKLALNKCNNLDMFLDSCAINKQELDLNVLDKDIDEIIEGIAQCLTTIESSQIRLKKMQNKLRIEEPKTSEQQEEDDVTFLKIEEREPEIKDEVFYFIRTDDDLITSPGGDTTTEPGQKEKENSQIVIKELKRKLVRREDLMRERERQALAKTMPELKVIPEFPRQINDEFVDRKGFILKLKKNKVKKLFRSYKIKSKKHSKTVYHLRNNEYENEKDISGIVYTANSMLNFKNKLITVRKNNNCIDINRWCKAEHRTYKDDLDSSGLSDGLSDVEVSVENNVNEAVILNNKKHLNEPRNYRFSKRELELSPSSSDSDLESYYSKAALLNDIRRHRPVRRKNFPAKKAPIDNVDEGLKPVKHSFGAGMAMASVLQVNSKVVPKMVQEEYFVGVGEVSTDSGNDEDA